MCEIDVQYVGSINPVLSFKTPFVLYWKPWLSKIKCPLMNGFHLPRHWCKSIDTNSEFRFRCVELVQSRRCFENDKINFGIFMFWIIVPFSSNPWSFQKFIADHRFYQPNCWGVLHHLFYRWDIRPSSFLLYLIMIWFVVFIQVVSAQKDKIRRVLSILYTTDMKHIVKTDIWTCFLLFLLSVTIVFFLLQFPWVAGGLKAAQSDNEDPGVVLISVCANRMARLPAFLSFFLSPDHKASLSRGSPGLVEGSCTVCSVFALWQTLPTYPHHNTWGPGSGVERGAPCVTDGDWSQRE